MPETDKNCCSARDCAFQFRPSTVCETGLLSTISKSNRATGAQFTNRICASADAKVKALGDTLKVIGDKEMNMERSVRDEAVNYLREQLSGGPKPAECPAGLELTATPRP